ncbi:MAG: IPTL-CTERM sorting domain-containing protein [Acidobacteriota bacterium]
MNTASISSAASDPDAGNNTATDTNTLVPSADLSITKTDGVTTAAPGGSLVYTIVASNAGPMDSFGATVTDTFPADLTCTWTCSASAGSTCSAAGSGDINDAVSLLNGGSATYTATCDIALGATGTLSNTATIAGMVSDSNAGNNSATDGDTVLAPQTDLSIVKADSVDPVTAGNSLVYTMTVTNAGPSNSTGATVTDVLPAGTTFSSSADCTEAGGTVTCAIGALGVGANQAVSFTVTVDPIQTAALSNTATVAANETDPTAANDSATEATAVDTSTDLSIAKADSVDPVNAGDDLTYTLTVTNNGPSNSTGATVTDVLPAGTTFSSSADCTEAGGTVTCTIGALAAAGNQAVSFTVTVDPAQTAALSNTATVAANETDPTAGNDSATEATAVDAETDLSITKADSVDPVTAGNDLTYTLTVTNNGPSNSTGATVTDVLPAGTTFSSSADCTEAGGTVTCTIGALAAAGNQAVSFTVTVDPAQTAALSNTATVAANETDPTAGNDSATEATAVDAETDLSITKADSVDPVTAGNDLTYTLTVTNNGPAASTGATVTDVLPAGTTFSSSADCSEAGGTVTCAIGALAVGANQAVSFIVTVDPAQTAALSNTATVAANETDSTAGNDSATEATAVDAETDLSITKADSADPVNAGDDLTYTLTVTNNGPAASTGATVTDVLPAGTTFSSSADCTEAGGTVTCAIGALGAGANQAVSFTVTVDPAQTAALSNTATVAANETDPAAGNDSATEATAVAVETDLSIAKADSADPVTAGDDLTYTLTVTNNGPSNSTGGTVTDVLPAGTTFSSSADCTEAGGTVTCAIGPLVAGANQAVSFTVTVDPAQVAPLSNTATVAANETDPDAANDSATEATSVDELTADLSITKDDGVTTAAPGGMVTYTIVASNAGPADVSAATVTDMFPPELTCSWTCSGTGGGTCTAAGTGDLAESVDLPNGSSVTFLAACAIDPSASGTLTNTATIGSTVTDPNAANDSATDVDTLGPSADLMVTTLVMPNPAGLGELVTLQVTITNAGPSDADDVALETILPDGLTFDSTLGCTEDPTGVPTCSLGLLAAGATVDVAITATATGAGASSGDLSVTSTTDDPDGANNTSVPTVTIGTAVDIPVLDPIGLAGLVLLLSAAGWLTLRRRRASDRPGS